MRCTVVVDRRSDSNKTEPGGQTQSAARAGEMVLAERRLKRRSRMHDMLIIGGAVVGWFALQAFVLPKLGFST
jgi:hypothetical protein